MTRPLLYGHKMTARSVNIPTHIWEEIVREAKERHITANAVIRERLEARSTLDLAPKKPLRS